MTTAPAGRRGIRARWSALHWSTRAGGIAGAVLTALALVPVAAAVLLMRCCESTRGASPAAWVLVMTFVALAALLAGGVMAAVVAGVRRLRRAAPRG